jgi:hypothetical protein
MNIKALAKQAGIDQYEFGYMDITKAELDKFAALAAAYEAALLTAKTNIEIHEAVLEEREECAKMIDHILKESGGTYGDLIRARSNA